MKNVLFLFAGISAAYGFVIASRANARLPAPVEDLAHRLEVAWAGHPPLPGAVRSMSLLITSIAPVGGGGVS